MWLRKGAENMQETILWEVIPQNEPTVLKNCPKCNGHAIFENSGKFRVNANQSKLDVWLIYQCRKCKSTWNMTLLTRVSPKDIDETLYKKFLDNDRILARHYAFDISTHMQNKSMLNYDEISYEIIGESVDLENLKQIASIRLQCDYPFDIRVEKILREKLGISRARIKKLVEKNLIRCEEEKNIAKIKLRRNLILKIG